jgi:hypothetical protein
MDSKELKDLMEAYSEVYASQEEIEEAVKGESSERRKSLAAERRAGHRPLPAKEGEKYASHKLSQMAYAKRKRMSEELDIFDVVLEFLQAEGYAETLEEAEWLMANVIDEEAIDIILGEGYKPLPKDRIKNKAKKLAKDTLSDVGTTLNPFKSDYEKDVAKHNMRKREKRVNKMVDTLKTHKEIHNEEYMDEAQAARENPEKYEREQSKKYAPVRGERTPMPPRGDKRREDFEKWYRANVR